MRLRIFDIQRFSVQDGPGIRTTVFLKGCAMRCRWCHNPESLETKKNLLYYEEKCVSCGLCASVCPKSVHQFEKNETGEWRHVLNRELCQICGACAKLCPEGALELAGYEIDTEELVAKLLRDREFYEISGGGVTFSGGEPLLQAKEIEPVLTELHRRGIHTAIETCSYAPAEAYQRLWGLVDLWICDVKAVTTFLHEQGTGRSNQKIFENIQSLAAHSDTALWVRVPLIPGFNNTMEEVGKIAAFIKELGENVQRVECMAYHDTGRSKYAALGWEYPMGEQRSMTKVEAEPFRRILERK